MEFLFRRKYPPLPDKEGAPQWAAPRDMAIRVCCQVIVDPLGVEHWLGFVGELSHIQQHRLVEVFFADECEKVNAAGDVLG